MVNRMKHLRSVTPGSVPPNGVSDDYGRIAVNLTDGKVWAYNTAGTPQLVSAIVSDHRVNRSYRIGDLTVHGAVLYRCKVNINPKAFNAADWDAVSDFRATSLYRNPTTSSQISVNMANSNVTMRVTAHPSQTVDLTQWSDADGGVVATVQRDGYPGPAFGRPVFRVDQVAHSFSAVGQPAAFDGSNWVLANPNSTDGFAIGVVSRIIGADAVEIQVAGMVAGMQAGAFQSGAYAANTIYYASVSAPGKLTATPPPDATKECLVLETLTGGRAVLRMQIPMTPVSPETRAEIRVTQNPNPFNAVGQIAAHNGSEWVRGRIATADEVPIGIIAATSGFDFTVVFSGEVTGIETNGADVFPLTPGSPYYTTSGGRLTLTAPTGNPMNSAPVFWATGTDSGIALAGRPSNNMLRASQNLGDLGDVPAALTNLGLNDVVRTSRAITFSPDYFLQTVPNLAANMGVTLAPTVIMALTAAVNAVQPNRSITSGTGLTGGGNLSADRSFALTGQALALHTMGGTGFMVRTGAATFTTRSLAAGTGISISNLSGVSGNPTIAVDSTVVRTSRTFTAGDGLSGGGNFGANREFAVDNTVVRTSGAQNIGGVKTFTDTTEGLRLRLSASADASLSSTLHALQMGASNSTNIRIDTNEIIALDNGAASLLTVNRYGGGITLGAGANPQSITLHGGVITLNGTAAGTALATEAEANAGSSNTALMTPLRTAQAPHPAHYESPERNIVKGESFNLNHGLGARPSLVQAWLVCKTSELGWAAGDWYGPFGGQVSDIDNRGLGIAVNDTAIKVRLGAKEMRVVNEAGMDVDITPGNWRLLFRAWR